MPRSTVPRGWDGCCRANGVLMCRVSVSVGMGSIHVRKVTQQEAQQGRAALQTWPENENDEPTVRIAQ